MRKSETYSKKWRSVLKEDVVALLSNAKRLRDDCSSALVSQTAMTAGNEPSCDQEKWLLCSACGCSES